MPDTLIMRRLKRTLAAQRRADEATAAVVADAIDAGVKQVEVARLMGRSREYVRLLVDAERKRRAG